MLRAEAVLCAQAHRKNGRGKLCPPAAFPPRRTASGISPHAGSPILSNTPRQSPLLRKKPGRTQAPAAQAVPERCPRSADKWGHTGIAGSSSCAPARLSYQPRPNRRICGLTSAFLLPAARQRASGVRDAQLFSAFVPGRLMPDYPAILALFLPAVSTWQPRPPELPRTTGELQLSELLLHHQAAPSFPISHKRRYAHPGRYRKQPMDMVGTTFRFCYALALPLTSFPQYFSCGSFLLTMENPSAIFWCKDSVISAVPFRMRPLPCVAHGDLLLMCLRAQLPDRASFSAHQKECLSLTQNYTFSGTPSLAGGFLLTKKSPAGKARALFRRHAVYRSCTAGFLCRYRMLRLFPCKGTRFLSVTVLSGCMAAGFSFRKNA